MGGATFMDKRSMRTCKRICMHLILIVGVLIFITPYLWVFLNSFKSNSEIFSRPFALPQTLLFSNYLEALVKAKLLLYFFNSCLLTFSSVAILLTIASMASYILSRFDFKLNFILYMTFTLGFMIMGQAVLLPIFITLRNMNLINTRIGLLFPYVALHVSINVMLMTSFMRTIPKALEEAAVIDGCSSLKLFTRVIIPLSKPVLATAGTLDFLWIWNELLFALVMISKPSFRTIPLGLLNLKSEFVVNYGAMSAGIILASIPVISVFLILQEQVIQGMTAGAVKG